MKESVAVRCEVCQREHYTEDHRLVAIVSDIDAETLRLRTVLAGAIDCMEDMVTYVPAFFREKWGYDAEIARLKELGR